MRAPSRRGSHASIHPNVQWQTFTPVQWLVFRPALTLQNDAPRKVQKSSKPLILLARRGGFEPPTPRFVDCRLHASILNRPNVERPSELIIKRATCGCCATASRHAAIAAGASILAKSPSAPGGARLNALKLGQNLRKIFIVHLPQTE